MFERENRREKILEARIREIRLKGRAKMQELNAQTQQTNENVEKVDYCKLAEEEFFAAVQKVKLNQFLKILGIIAKYFNVLFSGTRRIRRKG